MKKNSDTELAKLSKQVTWLIDFTTDNKSLIAKIAKDMKKQDKALRALQFPKGLNQKGRAMLVELSNKVLKLEQIQQLDQIHMKNTYQATREMFAELKQTVAANDL